MTQVDTYQAFAVNTLDCALEGDDQLHLGSVRWRTLVSADKAPSRELVAGVAEFGPHNNLKPHRHAIAEIYHGLSGSGIVTIDGIPYVLTAGTTLYIPPEAEHGTVAGPEGLSFFYTFAADRFSDVDYRMSE